MGAYLSAPVTEKGITSGTGGGGGNNNTCYTYAAGGMQGWRRTMEDAFLVSTDLDSSDPEAMLLGVYDGHGGPEVARFCADHMGQELIQQENYQKGQITQALQDVFFRMDQMLLDERFSKELEDLKLNEGGKEGDKNNPKNSGSNQNTNSNSSERDGTGSLELLRWLRTRLSSNGDADPNSNGEGGDGGGGGVSRVGEGTVQSGCTAVVALIKEAKLYVANAGDSRAVLSRGGKAVQLSEDHKPALDGERSRIVAAGGFLSEMAGVTRVNGNLNLSRAIGDLKYKTNEKLQPKDQIITAQPDVQCVDLESDDEFLVLACDGVWDVMSNDQVVDFVRSRLKQGGISLSDIICQLLDNCLATDPKEARGVGCDNITVVILQFKGMSNS
eukprot:TRINITY_DN5057_c1_g1_i1.p2 TRINITY_DN5057_c1_g1~~TRINITY_DN5057_c1_g1_i1.p2  ORF type:complete len:386 (+),score=70.29 TRINITY_DN5057_c1_g1_i1:203-1360(+)